MRWTNHLAFGTPNIRFQCNIPVGRLICAHSSRQVRALKTAFQVSSAHAEAPSMRRTFWSRILQHCCSESPNSTSDLPSPMSVQRFRNSVGHDSRAHNDISKLDVAKRQRFPACSNESALCGPSPRAASSAATAAGLPWALYAGAWTRDTWRNDESRLLRHEWFVWQLGSNLLEEPRHIFSSLR